MSEVTTLKQLMLDAARYRWLRENLQEFVDGYMMSYDGCNNAGAPCPEIMDELIDVELDRE